SLFFFQAEDGIRDPLVTGVQTCALPISRLRLGGAGADEEARRDRQPASVAERAREEKRLIEAACTQPGAVERNGDQERVGSEGIALGEQRAERVGQLSPAAILESLDRRRERIETGGRRKIQCGRASSGEGGWMVDAAGTRVVRADQPERYAARPTERRGRRRHGRAAGCAQARAVAEGQWALARLAVLRKDAVEQYLEPARHCAPR